MSATFEHLGPLAGLLGVWKGDKGLDVAPEKAGPDENPFHETITFEAVPGPVENAETQVLGCVRYVQVVQRKPKPILPNKRLRCRRPFCKVQLPEVSPAGRSVSD